ncbi:Transcriptional regulator, GntR family with aminotransferase domain containing protein [Burkholderia sp. 8Y]|uniref:MocR-like pyridoxine biosynthesis transcription factor PdxR n=1 Tax=Burkholderia sp. 8Y TaxID=2653133 RepID=UPI0012EFAF65|nr:PLP-dependent aminotransferase family protein [Burkholderia sp. 8Y]VXC73014.1 Transcriptional regulator, GntR family with aminotransferase domain containing protein [Burkholderia sp. 8Y]
MDIHITLHGRRDLTGQIYGQLRAGIIEGRLAANARLPSTRDLAAQLGVSRKTTLDVFDRLIAEGFLRTRAGDGTFVADGLARLPGARREPVSARARATGIWRKMPERMTMPMPVAGEPLDCDFKGGVTDKTLFPYDAWRRCLNQALRTQARADGGVASYRDPAGEQALRLGIARYLAFSRAVVCNWQDVVVTQGAQQALDLLSRVVVQPGDVVAVEEPGYPPARALFTARGARIAHVPVDAEGIVVSKLPRNTRLVYVTPSHQFPLGMPMSLDRRVELLEWAGKRGAVIVEDDYDGEYRFEGRPVESLKSLDRAGLVAYVGTFSKTIFPDLRIGYVVPPATLCEPLWHAKQISDCHTCMLTQTALAAFMLDGEYAKHLRRMHKAYAARRAALLRRLTGDLAPWFEPLPATAGIHLVARLASRWREERVVAAAREASIGLTGIRPFHAGKALTEGVLFGYGGTSVETIERGMTRLAALMPTLGD